uniref:Uncharacterized protein n=1 Tax=Romanomermis culicivorax TaxID=13658 RepID=A0A915J1C0_ROMCU
MNLIILDFRTTLSRLLVPRKEESDRRAFAVCSNKRAKRSPSKTPPAEGWDLSAAVTDDMNL